MLDFDNLPADPQEVEALVNSLDVNDLLITINAARNRVVERPDFVPSEMENRALILLVRRLRSTRENKKSTAKAAKPKMDSPLDSLL